MSASAGAAHARPEAAPVRRFESLALILLVLAGLLLRVSYPSRMAVEHFDEGVYASNLWFGEEHRYQYPDRHLYAPPLLSWFIEWSIVLLGPTSLATMAAGLTAGSLTPLLLWWTARRWFGIEAGLAAAAFAAFSDFHLLYSRTALTDILLVAWMLPAVFSFWKSYTARDAAGRFRWAMAAGFATALAWWTKYNGWLPLAIGLAGLIPWLVFGRRGWAEAQKCLASWLVAATVAGAAWSPALAHLPPGESYAAVAHNHRQYLVGWEGWPAGLIRHAASHHHFEGWLSCAGIALAVLAAAGANRWSADRSTWNAPTATHPSRRRQSAAKTQGQAAAQTAIGSPRIGRTAGGLIALMLAASAAVLGSSITWSILAVAGICLFALGVDRLEGHFGSDRQTRRGSDQALGAWLTAAWFCGLLLATPLYHPYPRLTLPWLAAAWLGAAAATGWAVRCLGPALNHVLAGTGMDRSEGSIDALPEANGASSTQTPAASRRTKKAERSTQIELHSASNVDESVHVKPLPIHLRWLPGLCCLLAAVVLIGSAERLSSKGLPGWQSRTGLESVAGQLLEDARRAAAQAEASPSLSVGYILYVYAEPGLFFHLSRLADDGVAHPAGNLGFGRQDRSTPDIPTFLVAGPHAWSSRDFAEQWSRVSDRFEEVANYVYEPSDLVLFDKPAPPIAGADGDRPQEEVRLYLLK